MKKLIAGLVLSSMLLLACSNNTYSADIDNPQVDESNISVTEGTIENLQKKVDEIQQTIDEEKRGENNRYLIETYEESKHFFEEEIKNEKQLLNETKELLIYNDEFSAQKKLAYLEVEQEATLSLKHTKNEYDSLMIERLNFYRKNGLLDRDVISTLILPISGDIKTVAISTYLDKDTVSKLDFEDEELSIIDEADAIYAHGSLSEYITPEYYKLTDEQHSAFFYEITGLMNTTIED